MLVRVAASASSLPPLIALCLCRPQYGTTPLVWAARRGHLDCVKHLLAMGADVDQEGAVRTFPFSAWQQTRLSFSETAFLPAPGETPAVLSDAGDTGVSSCDADECVASRCSVCKGLLLRIYAHDGCLVIYCYKLDVQFL